MYTVTLWVIKTHQNTFVHNFSKCWPILIEISVQKLATQYDSIHLFNLFKMVAKGYEL